jgi:hypothetical protein
MLTFRDPSPGASGQAGRSLLARWWTSRVGYRLGREVLFMGGLWLAYRTARSAVRGHTVEAIHNAREVMQLERHLGMFTEANLQRLVLSSADLVRLLNWYYVTAHFTVTITTLVLLYTFVPRGYVAARRMLMFMTAVAMAVHVLFPLAPPRMFPGFIDTGRLYGPAAYGHDSVFQGVANQIAAMPSLHFGWSVAITYVVVRHCTFRWRWLLLLHPALTLTAIVATANHYWMDAVVAGLIFLPAVALWGRPRRAPAEAELDGLQLSAAELDGVLVDVTEADATTERSGAAGAVEPRSPA